MVKTVTNIGTKTSFCYFDLCNEFLRLLLNTELKSGIELM
jgi:hypothetical protein